MNETKLDEASEKTSLFRSSRNLGTGGSNIGRDSWRATTSRLFLHHHQAQQRQYTARSKTYQHLYRHHQYHHLHDKQNQTRTEGSPSKQLVSQELQRCNADQASTVHQQHKQILLHHRQHQHEQSPIQQRKFQPSHLHASHLHTHFRAHRHRSPLLPPKQRRKKQHLQITYEGQHGVFPSTPIVAGASIIPASTHLTRPPPAASFPAAKSECPRCGSRGTRLQQNQYQHPYREQYQHQTPFRKGVPGTTQRSKECSGKENEGISPHPAEGARGKHCCGRTHPQITPTGSGAVITTTSVSACEHIPTISDDHIVFIWDSNYCRSLPSIVRLLQVVLSVVSLICLTTAGRKEGGYLSLPLCWHFRIMVFILVLTLMSSVIIWAAHVTGVASAFPVNWDFLDMVLYSVFAFLYLVGASLVASAFDFYEKMQVDVGYQTIQQLVFSVIIGYICLFLYGTTAILGYRQWRIQMNQYQRRKLLEEDDFEI